MVYLMTFGDVSSQAFRPQNMTTDSIWEDISSQVFSDKLSINLDGVGPVSLTLSRSVTVVSDNVQDLSSKMLSFSDKRPFPTIPIRQCM